MKRVSPVRGTNWTLSWSPSTAAAIARQKATSKPTQRPFGSGPAKPASPVLTPHFSTSFDLTASSVWAEAAPAARPPTMVAAIQIAYFMKLLPVMVVAHGPGIARPPPHSWIRLLPKRLT